MTAIKHRTRISTMRLVVAAFLGLVTALYVFRHHPTVKVAMDTVILSYEAKLRGEDSDAKLVNDITVTDLFAMTFYDGFEDSNQLIQLMQKEKAAGTRDRYFLPTSYTTRLDNQHFNDISNTDGWQKEVYLMARAIMRKITATPSSSSSSTSLRDNNNNKDNKRHGRVADIGAGSGYKLVKYLSPEFDTIGFETEPAISHLRSTYPSQKWLNSGNPEESLPEFTADRDIGNGDDHYFDMCICSDVVEHIRDPDGLMQFLASLSCRFIVISTPKREVLNQSGPPDNEHHVREWSFHEFQAYLLDQGFTILRSLDGIQHSSTQFHVVVANKKKEAIV